MISTVLVDPEDDSGTTVAHEIAHVYGWVDEAHTTISESRGHFFAPAKGYWVEINCEMGRLEVPDPLNVSCFEGTVPADFMGNGYVDNPNVLRWISKPIFEFLLDMFDSNPANSSVLQINGIIFNNGTGKIFPWYKVNGTMDVPLNNSGNVTVSYLDRNGTEIAQTGLNVNFDGVTDFPKNDITFAVMSTMVPDVPGTYEVEVKNGTNVIFERVISINPPQVQLLSLKGSEVFKVGEGIDVIWNTSQQSNNDLTYVVALSQDNGETWYPLSLGLTNEFYSFGVPINVNSTNSAKLKVSASDGINVVEHVTDSVFTLY